MSAIVELHSEKQSRAFYSDAPITLVGTGIQWGKTKVGALWLKRKVHEFSEKGNNFIITAPTYKVMNQSTLPAFLETFQGLGTYNKVDAEFVLNTGAKIYLRTGTDPNSIVGITNVRAIWGDEAGLYSLYFWENIQGRAAFKNAPIMLTTSPYSMNWTYKEIIKPYMNGETKDLLFISAKSIENPYFNKEYYNRKKRTMDPRRFQMMFGGEWGRMSGLVYDFDEDRDQIHPFALPQGTRFFAGIDWGYTEPFSMGVRAITPDGFHYLVSEFHKTQQSINQIIEACKQKMSIYPIERFFCGHDKPGMIEELCSNKIPAVSVDAGPGSKRKGLDLHYELIKSGKYKVFQDCAPHTIDEYSTYHYPEPKDKGPDDKIKDQLPVEQDDHAMDRERYITYMTHKVSLEKKKPRVPGQKRIETVEQRLKRLKKSPRTRLVI